MADDKQNLIPTERADLIKSLMTPGISEGAVQRWTNIYLNSTNPAMRRDALSALQSLERRENINRHMSERAAEK